MLSHLIRNAYEATTETDQREILVQLRCDNAHAVVLAVEDNGPAIPEEVRMHLFDPFYSGRQAGRGLGFGLCHCWQIARMHNGLLTHEPIDGGNRFIVVLPAERSR